MNYCQPVPGTVTSTGATFRTYVYEVWDEAGYWIGWVPTTPSGVTYAYTVNGIRVPPAVTITGPSYLGYREIGTWTANPSGGDGSYAYEWRFRYWGTGPWSGVISTDQQYSRTMRDEDFELQVRVSSNGLDAYDTHYVEYEFDKIGSFEASSDTPLPNELVLSQNFPNPFNPETEIRFALPGEVHVQLVVFDVLGHRVRELVNRKKVAGYHSVVWNGKDDSGNQVPSGIYVYRLVAGGFQDWKKLTLMR